MSIWRREPPKQIRAFVVHKNIEAMQYEFHLRGTKVAAVDLAKVHSPRVLDEIVDKLHNIHHHAIKFLNEHPEASIAPGHEGAEGAEVASHEELRA